MRDQRRFRSSYVGNLVRRIRDAYEASEFFHLTKLYHKNDPKVVIILFESQPSLHSTCYALYEYAKVLVKVDMLDESEMLKTLQKVISNSAREEKSITEISILRKGEKSTNNGVDEARSELGETVHYLWYPKCLTRFDGKLPKGVLLVGPPGVWKSMLARVVSGEVGVLFFSCSDSEFEEILTGVGVPRVRDLVPAAKKSSPCIICIDQIDAIRGILLIEHINFQKSLDKGRIRVLIGIGISGITVFSDGIHNLIEKMNHIRQGDGKLMIAGEIEAAIIPVGLGGCVVRRTLSQRSEDPRISSRP
ncbi:hypothetical protein GQ457_06G016270 [Hibiscus cannabinus]